MLIVTHEVNYMLRVAAEFNSGMEVGGFGHTVVAENGMDIICDDIYIPPQVVQHAHTDIKGPGEPGGDGQLEAAIAHWASMGQSWADNRLWWHSHGKLGVQPSGTDDNTLQHLARLLGGWAVGLVIDSSGGRHAWAAVHDGPLSFVGKIDFSYYRQELPELRAKVEEMMQHVEEKKWSQPTNPISRVGGGSSQQSASPALVQRNFRTVRAPKGMKRIADMSPEEFKEYLHGFNSEVEEVLRAGEHAG